MKTDLDPDILLARLDRLDRLALLLDGLIPIPGTDLRIGLDGLLGLVPVVGDVLTVLPGLYIIFEGYRLGARRTTLVKMTVNSAVDALAGSFPVFGDLFDIGFKANLRNVALLRADLVDRSTPEPM